jgi:hypothetical protein
MTVQAEKRELAKKLGLRIVHNQRKRKLRKKGRLVWWHLDIWNWVWRPE